MVLFDGYDLNRKFKTAEVWWATNKENFIVEISEIVNTEYKS